MHEFEVWNIESYAYSKGGQSSLTGRWVPLKMSLDLNFEALFFVWGVVMLPILYNAYDRQHSRHGILVTPSFSDFPRASIKLRRGILIQIQMKCNEKFYTYYL